MGLHKLVTRLCMKVANQLADERASHYKENVTQYLSCLCHLTLISPFAIIYPHDGGTLYEYTYPTVYGIRFQCMFKQYVVLAVVADNLSWLLLGIS